MHREQWALLPTSSRLGIAVALYPILEALASPSKKIWSLSNEAWQTEALVDGGAANALDSDYVWGYSAGFDGSVYMVGFSPESQSSCREGCSWDAFVAKYAPSGELAWKQLHGTAGVDDATSVTSAHDGSVLVAGFTEGHLAGELNSGAQDAFVVKYSTNGTHLWTRLLGTSSHDEARAIAAGNNGSVVVAGFTSGQMGGQPYAGNTDSFVTKLSEDGQILWTQMLGSEEHDVVSKVAIDQHDAVFIAGSSFGALPSSSGKGDTFLAKYSSDGKLLWLQQDLTIGFDREPRAAITSLSCARDGSVLLAGYTGSALLQHQSNVTDNVKGGTDAFIVRYSSAGVMLWAKLLGSAEREEAWSVGALLDGTFLLAGYTEGVLEGQKNEGKRDAFVAKYSSDGEMRWVSVLGSEFDDEAKVIATSLDPSEVYVVAGYTYGTLSAKLKERPGDPPWSVDQGGYFPNGMHRSSCGLIVVLCILIGIFHDAF